jgi:hypothetical protein
MPCDVMLKISYSVRPKQLFKTNLKPMYKARSKVTRRLKKTFFKVAQLVS